LGETIAELVRKTDAIVTSGHPRARAAKAVTTTVPIIAVGLGDPEGDALVQRSQSVLKVDLCE
jgi:ABC-type uncharacterized transport system substrate-binding protein